MKVFLFTQKARTYMPMMLREDGQAISLSDMFLPLAMAQKVARRAADMLPKSQYKVVDLTDMGTNERLKDLDFAAAFDLWDGSSRFWTLSTDETRMAA